MQEKKQHSVNVYFEDNTRISTRINGTKEEVRNYYAEGKTFNLGSGENDKLVKVKFVAFVSEDK